MASASPIPFRKMNGLGNDFVVLDARSRPLPLTEMQARAIADRATGIGCDQVVVLEGSSSADVRMRIWNSRGGEVESCGNASRCIADLLFKETGRSRVTIDTRGALLVCSRAGDGLVTVDMGVPHFRWDEIPLREEFIDTRRIELQVGPIDKPILHTPSAVNVGNPHCIFWVDDVQAFDLASIGPLLEQHPLFPEG
ncbi:MAG: diaminopimelate epimerase, partial [Pseudomonadota bacterium]|nr:diaminopimelate epimerase [Pseudomonadota bacterium]